MPRRWARFCLNIDGFVQSRLQVPLPCSTVLVGFSTGLDSTALLIWAAAMAEKHGFTVHAAHCNHGLRPEADQEAAMAAEMCTALDVPLHVAEIPVREHCRARRIGIEEGGRELRYDFLHQVAENSKVDWILTGHHQNDLAEDLLLRLIRGTGWPGLAGMQAVDRSRKLLRPFLHTPKAVLREFLSDLAVPWCEDDSNADPSFRRNRVRHELLPLLLRENPAFLQSVSRLWEQGERDNAFWLDRMDSAIMCTGPNRYVLPVSYLSEHPALRYRLYKKGLALLGPGQALSDSLDRLDRIVSAGQPGKTVQFPGDKAAELGREGVTFFLRDHRTKLK